MNKNVGCSKELLSEIERVEPSIIKKYIFLDRSVVEEIRKNAIEQISASLKQNAFHYIGILTKLLDAEIKSGLLDKEKKEYLINSYINLNYLIKDNSRSNTKVLEDICRYLNRIIEDISEEDIEVLLNNEIVDGVIKSIIFSNTRNIEQYGISIISNNDIVQKVLTTYCIKNDIKYKKEKTKNNKSIEYINISPSIQEPKMSLLSEKEEKELFIRYKSGDKTAKDEIVNHNLGLVRLVVNSFQNNKTVPYEDLYQAGCLGLVYSVDKFDLSKGNRFSTCATWWILRYVRDCSNVNKSTLSVSSYAFNLLARIAKARSELFLKLNREPTFKEISIQTGIKESKIQELYEMPREVSSLDSKGKDDKDDKELYYYLSSETESMDENIFNEQRKKIISKILDEVCENDIERDVINARFGFYGGNPITLKVIGQKYNASKEWVRKVEARVLRKLKQPKYSKLLEPYFFYELSEEPKDNKSYK